MVDALNIAGSALLAQQINVATIADNIANLATPGYEPKKAVLAATGQGVAVSGIVTAAQGGVNVSTEMVNLVVAQRAYQAALKVVGASQQMMSSLLQTL